jgi:hypothetical protein
MEFQIPLLLERRGRVGAWMSGMGLKWHNPSFKREYRKSNVKSLPSQGAGFGD